jgi:hypothetical protein
MGSSVFACVVAVIRRSPREIKDQRANSERHQRAWEKECAAPESVEQGMGVIRADPCRQQRAETPQSKHHRGYREEAAADECAEGAEQASFTAVARREQDEGKARDN